jgi:putative protein kinase ArgK-like GTPase of G3E family
MLEMAHPIRRGANGAPEMIFWQVPVLMVCSTGCQGSEEVMDAIARHQAYADETGERQRRDAGRLHDSLHALLRDTLMQRWLESLPSGALEEIQRGLVERSVSPFEAIERLLGDRAATQRGS